MRRKFRIFPLIFPLILPYFFIRLSNSTKPTIFRACMAKPTVVGFAAEKKEGFAILWFGILRYSWGKNPLFPQLTSLVLLHEV